MEKGKEVAQKETQELIEKLTEKINILINKMKQSFPPAEDEASSTHLLTTTEFELMLIEHDSTIDFAFVDLVDILEKAGYKNEAVEEDGKIGFKWLINSL